MADFGGFMRFTYSGTPLRMRGSLKTMPMDSEFKPLPNQDGSVDRTQTPKEIVADITFVDTLDSNNTNATPTSIDWNAVVKGGRYNMTVIEDSTGITHQWTNAVFTGTADVDRENGLVTGLKIACGRGNYTQTTS